MWAWVLLIVGMGMGIATAQPVVINCGSPADSSFVGGTPFTDNTLGTAPFNSLRYGTSFSYRIPSAPGIYRVRLSFIEPNKTAAGQRLFTVRAGGTTSDPVDIFAVSGAHGRTTLETTAPSTFGYVEIVFTAILGNAVVSSIEVSTILNIGSGIGPFATMVVCPHPRCSGIGYVALNAVEGVCVSRCIPAVDSP